MRKTRAYQVGLVPTFYFGLTMVAKQPFADRINEAAFEIAKQRGLEFVHAEILGSKRDTLVRIFIDKEAGVTLDDCSGFSSAIEEVFDAEDLIPWAYTLEVSSPGIERQLFKLDDFIRFKGELARVKANVEINGQKNFVGTIRDVESGRVIFEDRTCGEVSIPYDSVIKANLKIDLGKELKGR